MKTSEQANDSAGGEGASWWLLLAPIFMCLRWLGHNVGFLTQAWKDVFSVLPSRYFTHTSYENFLKNKLQAAAALHALRRGNIYYTAVFSISFFSFLFFFIFLNFYARARAYAICVLLRRIHVVVRSLVLRW